jgi:hypothetical protein
MDGIKVQAPEKIEHTVDRGDLSLPKEDVKAVVAEVAAASCSSRLRKMVKIIASICRIKE